ncbi:hypothetical protein FDP22_22745 (plasmid) [Paroceanicella profunda]|uniref:Sulfotransferase family protein n=1 Tax=Paroceanicella profunda TaxID=2579971 RepID=A0A5B8G5C9_9RHOB|nr:hypothetical protein [Paroceanicella profunda]QDL94699.1 hypothetical protein FDP22_22745 [Paroceanicella profunda]
MTQRKRLVLHIGSHKTATTFIQGSLVKNQDVLKSHGIIYPRAGQIYDAHFRLCWELRDPKFADLPLTEIGEWARLIEEIQSSPATTAIVSSEEFGLLIAPERLAPLRELFDIQVIYYLRSPDAHLESFYNQFVKDFGTRETRTINHYLAEERLGFLDTRTVLEPWVEVFGARQVSLRIFSRQTLPNGVLQDFLETVGVRQVQGLKSPDVSVLHKVSLPPDALEYLRYANQSLTREQGHHPFVVSLVQMAGKHGDELQTTRAGILSLKSRKTLRFRFADANRWAARTLLDSDRSPFPPRDVPAPPEDFDQRPETADAHVIGRVAALIQNYTSDVA